MLAAPSPMTRALPSAAVAAAILSTACSPAEQAPAIELSACHLKGTGSRSLCGTYRVYEDREAMAGRRIDLYVAVVPALKRSAADPVFFLAGGPGQSAVLSAEHILPALGLVRRHRDIVFIDVRGTGKSNPLRCDLDDPNSLEDQLEVEFPLDRLAKCAAELDADTTKYTTEQAVLDLEEVRQALGYRQVSLVGASYGTRLALAYAKRFPTNVRAMVLDGVAPPQQRLFLDFMPDGQRALDLLLDGCSQERGCSEAFPDLRANLDALLADLARAPARAHVRHPRTDEEVALDIHRESFAAALRFMLYSPRLMQLTPLMIEQARAGDWGPFIAQATPVAEQFEESLSLGLMLSVTCAEDVPRISEEEKAAFAEKSFLGGFIVDEFRKACEVWPHAKVDASVSEAVHSTVPTLLLSGGLDPVTPPRWGDTALETLPNGRHVVAPGHSHGVLVLGCAPRVVADLIETGSPKDLDVGCIEEVARMPFFVDRLGPAVSKGEP